MSRAHTRQQALDKAVADFAELNAELHEAYRDALKLLLPHMPPHVDVVALMREPNGKFTEIAERSRRVLATLIKEL